MILLNSIVVVLNETIEAGILISVLLSISHQLKLAPRWWLGGVALGLSGSLLYAQQLATLSEWFDYGGQEVINSSLQLTVFALTLAIIKLMISGHKRALVPVMALAMGLAMVREGAEIVVFYLGISTQSESTSSLLTSGFVGASIGASIGALIYYFLILIPGRHAARIQLLLLALISSGMVLQASQLLIQIDWLPVAAPLWNSSALLPEHSALGQLAYAVFGYESTPSATEMLLYIGALVLSLCVILLSKRQHCALSAAYLR